MHSLTGYVIYQWPIFLHIYISISIISLYNLAVSSFPSGTHDLITDAQEASGRNDDYCARSRYQGQGLVITVVVVDVLLTIRSQFDSYVILYTMQAIQHCKKIQYQQHTHKTDNKHFGVGLKSSKVSGKHLWRWKTYTISNVWRAFISAREQ